MYSVECRVGRLVEARVVSLKTMAEFEAYQRAVVEAFARVPGKPIGCCDLRPGQLFPPDVADALVGMLARGGTRLHRSAILLPFGNASLYMQIERLVREARTPDRKTFRVVANLDTWLAEVLTDEELARLREFLEVKG